MKIERLLAITVLLLNRRRATAGELAERFRVSVRTIYRDLETLNGASIPINEQQLRVEPDGTLIATITLPESDWIVSFLLGFGDMVEALSTPRWRERISKKCTRMQKTIYRNMT